MNICFIKLPEVHRVLVSSEDIKEFTGKDFNHRVPVGEVKWDKTDPPASVVRAVKYWSGIYLTLKKNPLVKEVLEFITKDKKRSICTPFS